MIRTKISSRVSRNRVDCVVINKFTLLVDKKILSSANRKSNIRSPCYDNQYVDMHARVRLVTWPQRVMSHVTVRIVRMTLKYIKICKMNFHKKKDRILSSNEHSLSTSVDYRKNGIDHKSYWFTRKEPEKT